MSKIFGLIFLLLISLITSALRGIDVSYHNGEIDFTKVKSQVDFVIMRAGYGNKDEDSKEVKFSTYYEDAKKNNIPVGTYWYCYALTPEEALVEAQVFMKRVKGKKFEFPVYYDVEEPSVLETGSENLKNMINTFCGELERNNYYCGVYASLNVFLQTFPAEIYQNYAVWVAYWSENRPQINGTSWGIWQYTSDGSMDGVESQRVDFDTAEINYEPIIKFLGKNGYKTKKLNSLEIDNKLFKVAEAHCKYLCTNGTSGHIGSEGSTLKNRIEKQKIKSKEYDECIVLGYNNPISIINCLVISRYSKNKKDRKILLNDKFKKVGIALGEHLCFGYCCVIVFSD